MSLLPPFRSFLKLFSLSFITLFLFPTQAFAQPTFSKAFFPATIGPGSVSTLTFTIANGEGIPVDQMAFTDVLPAGVIIATPASVSSDCGGTVTAPDGGTTITFIEGGVGTGVTCTIRVNVTSSTIGTHMNVSGDLTSSAGNSGPATADLIVTANRPGFSKSFSPSAILLGERSTLTFTIDNTANPSLTSLTGFTDNLPVGMVVANPANVFTDCSGGSGITAVPGSSVVTMGFSYFIVAGASCIISVDVTATGVGLLNNVSGELTASSGGPSVSSGKASDVLTVTVDELTLTKTFLDDPAIPGTTADLEFTITNRNRDDSATNITFTDDLDATLSGLVAVGLPQSDVCGAGSTLTGSSLLTLTGGNLAAEASCTFSVTLQVPAGAAVGDYVNTTSTITADVGGAPLIGSPATDTLFVDSVPILTKTFLNNPIGAGDSTTMEFTITNSSTTSAATNIAFTDNLSQFFSGILVTGLPAANYCGPGSFITITSISGESYLLIGGANLAAGASCTFTVDLLTPAGGAAGSYDNITSDITATIDGETKVGDPAEATLQLISSPFLTKRFVDDPVLPGETVQLEFTIANGQEGSTAATEIQFTDDLNGVVSGLTALGLPATDVCGAGSQIAGTTNLTFTGGSLAPAESCTFTVTLQVPASTLPGSYDNITSNTTAVVSGYNTVGNAAGDTLEIAGLSFSKSFTNDPVLPGGSVTLEFTIVNESPTNDVTSISFTDNLNNVVSGLAATGLPMSDICGAGSQIIGTSSLTFVGGNLTAGSSCTFSVTLNVPAAAASNIYYNVTSNLAANVGGNNVSISPAADQLTISDQLLFLSKSFENDPVPAGGTVNLSFTLSNLDPSETVTNITFTDDLDAALSGLTAVGLPANDVCGAGSQLSGTSLLTLTGGQLAPSTSCTFVVTLQVPAAVPFGTTATNTTSQVTGSAGGLGVTGDPATDDLQVEFLIFEKSFAAPAAATGTAELIFSITNLDSNSVAGISFLDDLNAMLPGATAVGLPLDDVCGSGSQLTGSSLISLSNGTLEPGAMCEFSVLVQIPAGAASGEYLNSTGNLALSGIEAANPATATLSIEPPPLFSKSFIPDSIGVGQTSELTLVIDNRNSALPANGLSVTDNLPAGMVVAQPSNSTTTCFGGTLTAVAGAATISYSGGGVPAGDICIIQVDVTVNSPGIFVNITGGLTSSSGASGTAMASLTVNNQPTFAKSFTPDELDVDEIATLLFTIDNSSSTVDALDLSFTDNLPPGLAISPTPNASTTCTGGILTAVAGTATISYTGGSVAAGSSCTLTVDVASSVVGDFVNVTEPLLSSLGSSGTATATITFNPLPTIAVAKTAAPSAMPAPGGNVSFTVQVTNTSPIEAVDLISLMDDVYGGLQGQGDCVLPQTIASGMAYTCQFTGAVSGTAGQVFTDTVTAIAQDSDGNEATGQASASVSLFDGTVYLPMISNRLISGIDLVVSDLVVNSAGIEVVVSNVGNEPVNSDFWVDLYINPEPIPTAVNQIWPNLSEEGLVWGVIDFTEPTQTLTLAIINAELSNFSGVIPAGAQICAQVDSAAANSADGAVSEIHEILGGAYNNISCITVETEIVIELPDSGLAQSQ